MSTEPVDGGRDHQSSAGTEPTIVAITDAVEIGRAGDVDTARRLLVELWTAIGVGGDAVLRCVLAHYLADLYPDAAHSLAWNVRSLDAADGVAHDEVVINGASVSIASFYPSLHLNLADDYRRLGAFEVAADHVSMARAHASQLGDDQYGDWLRGLIEEMSESVSKRDTAVRVAAHR